MRDAITRIMKLRMFLRRSNSNTVALRVHPDLNNTASVRVYPAIEEQLAGWQAWIPTQSLKSTWKQVRAANKLIVHHVQLSQRLLEILESAYRPCNRLSIHWSLYSSIGENFEPGLHDLYHPLL
jgi:hypothetical protein